MTSIFRILPCLFALSLTTFFACAEEILIEDNFDRDQLGKGWTVQTGDWKIVDGVLQGTEIEADNHSAAARKVVQTSDAVYRLKFRFSAETGAFHFGFDPARGELQKRGHLFSVIVGPTGWRIMKHVDKNRPKEDPNEILARAQETFVPGKWYSLEVVTSGTSVTATIDGMAPLEASHPTFAVKKPTLVFRVIGDTVEIDDVAVVDKSSKP